PGLHQRHQQDGRDHPGRGLPRGRDRRGGAGRVPGPALHAAGRGGTVTATPAGLEPAGRTARLARATATRPATARPSRRPTAAGGATVRRIPAATPRAAAAVRSTHDIRLATGKGYSDDRF